MLMFTSIQHIDCYCMKELSIMLLFSAIVGFYLFYDGPIDMQI